MDIKTHLPTILTFLGGALTIVGVAWASIRDNQSKREISLLQEKNMKLSNEAINLITGGDSWCYLREGFMESAGNVVPHGHIPLMFVFEGTIPMYDVSVVLYNSVPFGLSRDPEFTKKIGTLTNTMLQIQFCNLPIPLTNRKDYLVEITSRNGQIMQHLVYIKKDDRTWLAGTRVLKYTAIENHTYRYEILYEYIPEGFPEDPKFLKP